MLSPQAFLFHRKPWLNNCNNRKPLSALKSQYRLLKWKSPQNRTKNNAQLHHRKLLRPLLKAELDCKMEQDIVTPATTLTPWVGFLVVVFRSKGPEPSYSERTPPSYNHRGHNNPFARRQGVHETWYQKQFLAWFLACHLVIASGSACLLGFGQPQNYSNTKCASWMGGCCMLK